MNTNFPAICQLNFFCEEPFQRLARIEGTATIGPEGVHFEYAMTRETEAMPRGSVKKILAYADIGTVELRNHWISTTKIRFRARSLEAIETYPTTDPGSFEIEVCPTDKKVADVFVKEALAALKS